MFALSSHLTPAASDDRPSLVPAGRRRRIPVGAVLLLVVLLPACSFGGAADAIGSDVAVTPATAEAADGGQPSGGTGVLADLPTDPWVESSTRAVVTGGPVEVLDGPDGRPVTVLEPTTAFGSTRVLLVEEDRGDWLKVRLPVRPNHRVGWIPASSVEVEAVDVSVMIDLQSRTLAVLSGSDVVTTSPIAVGSDEHPTPVGTFYVTDKLQTADADGAYGPYAFGLSGYSETLTEFAGGNGQIGIHGTNDPSSIGQAVSHGCIRLPNDVVTELAELLPLGTPVHIV